MIEFDIYVSMNFFKKYDYYRYYSLIIIVTVFFNQSTVQIEGTL